MALPPEPIDSVLFDAKAVFVGEVTAVVSEGPAPARREAKKGHKDVGNKSAWQKVTLRVDDVLLAGLSVKKGSTVEVLKPEGSYSLSVGNKGPFLLGQREGETEILGRYGPDSYRLDVVTEALAKRK